MKLIEFVPEPSAMSVLLLSMSTIFTAISLYYSFSREVYIAIGLSVLQETTGAGLMAV